MWEDVKPHKLHISCSDIKILKKKKVESIIHFFHNLFLKFLRANFRNYYRFVNFFLFFPYFRVHQSMTTSVILIIVEWEINWYPLMHTTWPEINILRIRNNYTVKVFQAKDDVTYDKHLGLSQTMKQLKMIAKTSKCWANFQ